MKSKTIFIFCLCFLSISLGLQAQNQSKDLVSGISRTYNFDLSFDTGDFDLAVQSEGKYYALFIGVEEYKDAKIPDLEEPLEDAEKLKKVLQNYYTFEKENIITLSNPTSGEIGSALQNLENTLTSKDNLLIFYAGHGEWNAQSRAGYWLPTDANKAQKSTWYSNSLLRENIRSLEAKHVLIISDACFSGSLFRGNTQSNTNMAIQQMYDLPSRKAMTSGALRLVPDQSVFIEYLVRRLGQNPSKYLPASRLFFSFIQDVIVGSPGQIPQYGDIRDAGPNEGGDFVFIRR